MDHVIPAIPPVRPRVAHDGDDRPLDDVIEELLNEGVRGIAVLHGLRGAGKSTALGFLACRFAEEPALALIDNPTDEELAALDLQRLNVVASGKPVRRLDIHLPLRFWGVDQDIEYLLHAHPAACGDVMRRLAAAGRPPWPPALVVVLLDQFAADTAADDPEAVVLAHLRTQLASHGALKAAMGFCLALQSNQTLLLARSYEALSARQIPSSVSAILAHEVAINGLAGDALFDLLRRGSLDLPASISPGMIRAVGRRSREVPAIQATLRKLISNPQQQPRHAIVGSLLAAADSTWIPPSTTGRPYHFRNGLFHGVQWPAVDLREADLAGADFSESHLKFAKLTNCRLLEANFSGAYLRAADLMHAIGRRANFRAAILTQANFTNGELMEADFDDADLNDAQLNRSNFRNASFKGATLIGADLSSAIMVGAKLHAANFTNAKLHCANLYGVDLRSATLTNANFERAVLSKSNLENVYLPDAQLPGARLDNAQLTGSVLPRARMYGASLGNASLAEIEWEDADLRCADLYGATFHLGSSRSGLIDGPIALEGNMTGFYNDDFEDRAYKRPEEIRKANLRGADLRGAKLDGVNLYLVDLRDARLDPDALQHARNCGAILEDVPAT